MIEMKFHLEFKADVARILRKGKSVFLALIGKIMS